MSNNSPSRAQAHKKYKHVAIRRDPYWDIIHRWSVERTTTQSEMIERLVRTYAALLGEDLKLPQPAVPTKARFSITEDYNDLD